MDKYLKYTQGELTIKTSGQSMYEITDNVNSWLIKEQINRGQLTIFIKHTSASLCIQENASSDVMKDIMILLQNLSQKILLCIVITLRVKMICLRTLKVC